MSTVIDLRTFTNSITVPVIVFVDLQQEYVAAPRALALAEISEQLANCREILDSRAVGGTADRFHALDRQIAILQCGDTFLRLDQGVRATQYRYDL